MLEPDKSASSGPLRAVLVTVAVCLVCSLVVTTTAVLLRPRQQANRDRARQAQMLELIARQPGLEELLAEPGDTAVEARVVELETGVFADWIDPDEFDPRRAAIDPLQSSALPPDRDLAGLGRRALYATVVLVRRGGEVELVILPVHGQGYASTLYGYVAVSPDGATVRGLSFYEHGETPGLGSEIEDPEWLELWIGKRVRDDAGHLRIGVAADDVDPGSPDYPYQVDGLTGATRTCDGVTALLRFWLGDDGFGPFLARIRP